MSPEVPRPAQFASVALDANRSSLDKELTYAVPPEFASQLRPGFAVLVPLGRQAITGYVTELSDSTDLEPEQLKPILRILGSAPLFDANGLRLARWISAYYHCPLNLCLECLVPHGWQLAMQRRYTVASADIAAILEKVARAPRQVQIVELLAASKHPMTQKELEKSCGAKLGDALKKLVEGELLTVLEELPEPVMKPRRVQAVALHPERVPTSEEWATFDSRSPKQAAALRELLRLRDEPSQNGSAVPTATLAREFGVDPSALRALEKKGYIAFTTVEVARAPFRPASSADPHRVRLTEEQQTAVKAIEQALSTQHSALSTFLLQGVTASGKTEVYLTAIEKCLAVGRRALVLVPEIALTAQTVEIFQRRFHERVAILHSALGAGERFDEWRRARSGRADIVVGARSAVFAPCRNIGLIIIDEEHDHSYKQDRAPRYHARDLALKRASLENAVVVLGSATPSLESYHRATHGEYVHLKLTQRVAERPMPEVEIVDMKLEARMGALPVLSSRLRDELVATVSRNEQAILFLNRRGFATYVQCLGCGHVERCPNCDVALTYHRGLSLLRCHHCDHSAPTRDACPQCNGWMIGFTGAGTEKVESEVNSILAERNLAHVKTLRLDRDTTTQKGAHGKILGEFRQGKAHVLIGTQMVTKGLDFPNVTLVGVMSADASLNVPDFRAAERTFQLLAQVAGRAGRGEAPGRVLVQTLTTDHPAIAAACAHDYETFVKEEIDSRQSPPYPPFSHLVNIIASDEDPGAAKQRIQGLALALQETITREGDATELLGPVDCPLARIKGRYRFHLMLRDRNRPRLHRVLSAYDQLPRDERMGLSIDVDPMTIM